MRKLLVANRAEIAARIARTARAMDIKTVAVFSDPDASAPFVRDFDESVHLRGAAAADTYMSIEALVGAARVTGADAVHPGYGFLSENAAFARACAKAGLAFVGPPPEVIELLGSKLGARATMAGAGVPVLPGEKVGAGDPSRAARRVGYPLLVKADSGGGGRGMRLVRSPAELATAVAEARSEAEAAFGDGTVFLERYLERARHVEVQILGDTHGNLVDLRERDCSVQRRYQKLIEESPSPAVKEPLRKEMCEAALAAGKALGYVGAGTVEFVVDPAGRFWFLEVNARLQVEHPVTEMVTGLDIVELQLRVARGEPLPAGALGASAAGHAVEARIYAEDVLGGFRPVSGTLGRVSFPVAPGVRVDAGYESGSSVSPFYDAMLAKVIASGPTREAALRRLASSLEQTVVGGLPTNRELLLGILADPEFASSGADTGLLGRRDLVALAGRDRAAGALRLHSVAAALAAAASRRAAAPVQRTVPPGWRNVRTTLEHEVLEDATGRIDVAHALSREGTRLEVDGAPLGDVVVWGASPGCVDVSVEGVRHRVEVEREGDVSYVRSPLGTAAFRHVERFPLPQRRAEAGSLLAPMPGTVTAVLAGEGAEVVAGEALVVLEAMKMEHRVHAPRDGTLAELRVRVTDQVDAGDVLAVVREHGVEG